MNSYSIIALCLIVTSVASFFGQYAGYTVNGVVKGGSITTMPGLLGLVEWVWNSIVFLFDMVTFSIDGMPAFFSILFLLMGTLVLMVGVKILRGQGD